MINIINKIMGNINTLPKNVSCDTIMNNDDKYILINTLPYDEQNCLIKNTIVAKNEENIINNLKKSKNIIIYGKNCRDLSVYKKYKHLHMYGFTNVYIYMGGMFEWLLLKDVYGSNLFSTDGDEIDLLTYK